MLKKWYKTRKKTLYMYVPYFSRNSSVAQNVIFQAFLMLNGILKFWSLPFWPQKPIILNSRSFQRSHAIKRCKGWLDLFLVLVFIKSHLNIFRWCLVCWNSFRFHQLSCVFLHSYLYTERHMLVISRNNLKYLLFLWDPQAHKSGKMSNIMYLR